jgi:hypothetical protein
MGHATDTPYRVNQSGYARLCQAALYVGRALNCARNQEPMNSSRIAEIRSLVDEISGFSAAVDSAAEAMQPEANLRLLGPRCIARSTLFIALDVFTCPEKLGPGAGYVINSSAKTHDEHGLQAYSTQVIQLASEQMHGLSMEILSSTEMDEARAWQLGKVSPFTLDAMYCSAATFYWFLRESGTEVYRTGVEELDTFMETLAGRWKLSGKYQEIAKLHNVPANIMGNIAP